MPVGLQRGSSGSTRTAELHHLLVAPRSYGWVREKVPHLARRDSAIPPLSSSGPGSGGRQGESAQGERKGPLHFLDEEEGNLTPLTKSI